MKKTVPLKSGGFKKVYNNGKSYADRLVVIICLKNNTPLNSLGIVASKKVGKSIVRNKARRRIREVYRIYEDCFHPGYDIVIIARASIVTSEYSQIQTSILKLMKKHGILKDVPAGEKIV